MLECPDFDSEQGQEIFLFFETSRSFLGPTQPPIQWAPNAKVKNELRYTFPPPYMTWTKTTLFFVKFSIGILYFTIFYVGRPNIIASSGNVRNSEVRNLLGCPKIFLSSR